MHRDKAEDRDQGEEEDKDDESGPVDWHPGPPSVGRDGSRNRRSASAPTRSKSIRADTNRRTECRPRTARPCCSSTPRSSRDRAPPAGDTRVAMGATGPARCLACAFPPTQPTGLLTPAFVLWNCPASPRRL